MSPVIDTENAMRHMAEAPARRTRADQGVPLAGGGTLTSTNVQDAIDQLAANAGGSGGIADAPSDGTLYGRENAAWTAVPPSGLADAPSDGNLYARKNAAWTVIPPAAAPVAISDTAPSSPSAGNLWWDSANGQMYVYYNDGTSSQWVALTTAQSVGSGGGGTGGAGSFTTNIVGAGTYIVPSGKSTMIGEAWGGGGGSQQLGGGGGGYSKFSTSVTPGQTIYYFVGAGGTGANIGGAGSGGNSWVNPTANSQPSSNGCVGGFGGGAAGSVGGGGAGTIGTTNFQGGNGGNLTAGGGGGGAGSAGNGVSPTTSSGGAGGIPDGGAGGIGGGAPTNGSLPGGGGGGGSGTSIIGGAGGNGQVRLTFS